jgi:hypothetical protein
MTLRVTRQYGEVLGAGVGKARVARQYVEVLGTEAVIYSVSVSSVLALTGEQGNYLGTGESVVCDNTLNMTQEVVTSGLLQAVESAMSIGQTVGVQAPIYQFMSSPMNISSVVAQPGMVRNFSLESIIDMEDRASRPYYGVATTTLNLVQEAYWSETPSSTMNLVQTTDYGKTKGIEVSDLDLSQSVTLTADWSRGVSQDAGIGHSLTYYVLDACGKKSYAPYTGESTISGNPTPPDADIPFVQGLPEGERFQLQYPGIGEATDTVELRAPNLDNRERLSFTRINRETRGGRLTVFADPTWPQVNTLVLSFSGLKKTEVDDLQDFLKNYLGQEIGLIDWEGHQWVGIITTPADQAVQDSGGTCGRSWTMNLEFEGVMLEEMPSGSHMFMSQAVVAVVV